MAVAALSQPQDRMNNMQLLELCDSEKRDPSPMLHTTADLLFVQLIISQIKKKKKRLSVVYRKLAHLTAFTLCRSDFVHHRF